jgi:uncharacterized protein YecE (DUF72 family)
VGTSGWSYDHWSGPFYPPDLPASERLAHYAGRLDTVEINNSFYHLPEEAVLREWRETVPQDFLFAAKGSRYVTHMRKLKDPDRGLPNFLERMAALGERLGPLLFQLPPRWRYNGERLEAFLDALGGGHRCAFEFRDPSWHNDEAMDALARHGAAFCIYHLAGFLSPRTVTTDFVYVRLHGPGEAYQGSYDEETLAGWAQAFAGWAQEGRDVYCYLDNDQEGYAAANALKLRELLAHP